jgi:cellulose synthase/poly-beta-1,6-N-acetylglucosamine synthase-like glycosyltransferase
MISIIITAWKEEDTIAKALSCFLDQKYSNITQDFEILVVAPDEPTILKAIETAKHFGMQDKLVIVKDQCKGKPAALNLAFKKVRGDIIFLTDGDVYVGENVVSLMYAHFKDNNVGIVTARPRSIDPKNNLMGYMGHLLADAAHHKRTIDLTESPHGKSLKIIPKRSFFPATGYLFAMRKFDELKIPDDCLVDDAYISYYVYNKGFKIVYEADAIVYLKYPKNLNDYFKQKKRSTGGYVQLWKYGIVSTETKSRTFFRELEYFWYPIKYAKNITELFWSICMYPLRLWLWLMIYWERKILNKDFAKTWTRIESTK